MPIFLLHFKPVKVNHFSWGVMPPGQGGPSRSELWIPRQAVEASQHQVAGPRRVERPVSPVSGRGAARTPGVPVTRHPELMSPD